jgi:oxygen-dependent protoporphyrinogen oxidase
MGVCQAGVVASHPASPAPPGAPTPPRVVVVGAGIAGLAAAAAVRARLPGATVTVLEASDRVGGKLRLAEVAGVTVDVGAEAMLNRRPEAVALARTAGLADRLVHPATTSSRIWSRGRLHRLPRSVLGVPADLRDLADSGVVSRHGAARAAMEPMLPVTRLGDSDVAVGRLVEERFGREVVDRLLEPLLGGVFAGHARELSVRAATPQVAALLDDGRSLAKAAAAAVARESDVPVFAGLVGGVGGLPAAVAADLDVRLGVTVRGLTRREAAWELLLGSAAAPTTITAEAVVLATPAPATARILRTVAPDAAAELAGIEYASSAVVTMAFRAHDLPPTTGSGFLVPPVEGRTIKASTFSFAKWDWVRQAGCTGSDDLLVLRTSVGRHREARSLQVDDDELVQASVDDLAAAIGLSVRPVDAHVQRWGGALPQYAVGHLDRVRRVRRSVGRQPSLAVCGAAYDGIGIAACVGSALRAADEVVAALRVPVL